jgi:hypothetical protein
MNARVLCLVLLLLTICPLATAGKKQKSTSVDEMQLPADYGIDIQLAINSRSSMMSGANEITGTAINGLSTDVFDSLVRAGFSQPYPWKLTLVNNGVVNAGSTAGGQVYVYGGLANLLSSNPGLWAAALSHEVAHTGLRHQVKIFLQQVYNQRMIQYYQAQVRAGVNGATWGLLGFQIAAPIALKKIERNQEHAADQTGMMLMARAGYHPDFVFALHHILRLQTGEQSKFAAFFSDHPRWETRDQRSESVYADSLAEYNRLWPQPEQSPGGTPPPVAFLGTVTSTENKAEHTADVFVPLFCRNEPQPIRLVTVFLKDGRVIKTGTAEADVLQFSQSAECPAQEASLPLRLHIPLETASGHDRKMDARLAVVGLDGTALEISKQFKVVFPKK